MLTMDKKAYIGIVIRVGHELWLECHKPEQEHWFAHFLEESEENFTLVVLRCIQVLCELKGDEWVYTQGLELICEDLVEALDYWS